MALKPKLAAAVSLITWITLVGSALKNDPLHAGIEVRNGGDVLECRDGGDFVGLYTLDYILTYQRRGRNQDIVPVRSWEESVRRLSRQLQVKLPKLYRGFKGYVELMDNFNDYSLTRIWREAPLKLVDIKDEDYYLVLPENCYESSGAEARIIQAIIRTRDTDSDFKSYLYDFDLYSLLKEERPLQFSFLMLHEWLWDYYPPEKINMMRDAVRLLHSDQLESLSAQKLWLSLKNLGISVEHLGPKPGPDTRSRSADFALGIHYSCFLSKGRVHCWGDDHGPAGRVPHGMVNPRDIAGGDHFACVLADNGVHCFGRGQALIRPPGGLRDVVSLEGNGGHMCALTKYDGIMCWGYWSLGRLSLFDATSFRLGARHRCGFGGSGIKCWVDIASSADQRYENHLNSLQFHELNDYDLTEDYSCFIDSGDLACHLGDRPQFGEPPVLDSYKKVSLGSAHGCVIGEGKVRCWGDNSFGQLDSPSFEIRF